jgi:hypothetical protein
VEWYAFFIKKSTPTYFFVANQACSVLTQDNMRKPDVAFCAMSGVTQTDNKCLDGLHQHPIKYLAPLFDNRMFVIIIGFLMLLMLLLQIYLHR